MSAYTGPGGPRKNRGVIVARSVAVGTTVGTFPGPVVFAAHGFPVKLKADNANTTDIYVGGPDVTVGQGYKLIPGATVEVYVTSIQRIGFITLSGTGIVRALVEV